MPLYRHVKRGSIYEIVEGVYELNTFSEEGSKHVFLVGAELIEAEMQFSLGVKEGSKYAGPIIVYRGTDNKVWLRPTFEFFDGRFEEVK